MNVTGILWTLYPLLGFLAFTEFVVGLAHVFFCLPFFIFLIPIFCGITASITSIYALMLHTSNSFFLICYHKKEATGIKCWPLNKAAWKQKTELLLQFLSSVLSFTLFLTSVTEAGCLRRLRSEGGESSVCAGILNRTIATQTKCLNDLNDFQDVLFVQIDRAKSLLLGADSEIVHYQPPITANGESDVQMTKSVSSGRDANAARAAAFNAKLLTIRISVASVLTLVSLTHFTAGVILALYSAFINNFRLSTSHWQGVFGFFTILFSYAYYAYCCVFFYTYYVTVIALFCLLQVSVPYRYSARSTQRQLFSIAGAALSTLLLAFNTFGFYCWSNQGMAQWKFDRDTTSLMSSDLIWNRTEKNIKGEVLGLFRYCHKPKHLYMICERSLQFSTPYIFWTQNQVGVF